VTLGSCGFPVSRTPTCQLAFIWDTGDSRIQGVCSGDSRIPSVRDTGDSQILGVREFLTPRCPGNRGVLFWLLSVIFKLQTIATAFESNNLSKIIVHLLFTIQILLVIVFKIFLTLLILLWLPVSWAPGRRFKTWIPPWKFAKNENGSRKSLIGPRRVVWWKTRL